MEVILSDPVTDLISTMTITNSNGEFWIGGIDPGKYSLWLSYSRSKEIDHDEIIEIKQGEKKEILREF